MKTVVAKFGGTSLADAGQFQKIKDIIEKDPSRRFIVASAPGKRFTEDIKVTDMLLRCYQITERSIRWPKIRWLRGGNNEASMPIRHADWH